MLEYPAFIKVDDDNVLSVKGVNRVDFSEIEKARLTLYHDEGVFTVCGFFAFEALMVLKPSAMEGKRLRWMRFVWMSHNLLGHPVLEFLAWGGRLLQMVGAPEHVYKQLFRWGMWVHDRTVPRPLGTKGGD